MYTTLQVEEENYCKKLESPRLQAVVDGLTQTPRLIISDKKDGVTYLITGTNVSVIPRRMVIRSRRSHEFQLFAVIQHYHTDERRFSM